MKLTKIFSLIAVLAILLTACAAPAVPSATETSLPAATSAPQATATTVPAAEATATPAPASASGGQAALTVMTHDSFAVTEDLVKQFEMENNVKVTFVKSGDAGAALNKAILTKNAPTAEVFYGVDNAFLSRALQAGLFEPYNAPALAQIPDAYKLDPANSALPVDYGDVCINYDKAYFKGKNLAAPATLEDLAKPDYKGLLVTENPATSSPGLAFLLATIVHFGPDKYLDYWKSLKANGVVVVNGWEAAYYTNFSASTGKGPQSLVVSYATSPAAEVVFANPPISDAPTASVTGSQACFRQVEFVGILKGTQQRKLAEKFVDFMLGKSFQEDMPLQMFVNPVLKDAAVPEAFQKYAQAPAEPATLAPEEIAKNRDAWINAWTELMLK